MGKHIVSFALGMVFALGAAQVVNAFASDVYTNLQKSRDALLDQRQHLQEQYDQCARLVDQYQQRLSILDGYLKQNDQALRDIDSSLRGMR